MVLGEQMDCIEIQGDNQWHNLSQIQIPKSEKEIIKKKKKVSHCIPQNFWKNNQSSMIHNSSYGTIPVYHILELSIFDFSQSNSKERCDLSNGDTQ